MGSKTLGPPSITNPYISPNFTANDWKVLDLSRSNNLDWQQAVDIFYDRINGRFSAPINEIANHPDCQIQEFSGFSIIAIDCLLIETLHQFYKGVNETQSPHREAFWDFFRNSIHFMNDFDTRQKAFIFYSHSVVKYFTKHKRKSHQKSEYVCQQWCNQVFLVV